MERFLTFLPSISILVGLIFFGLLSVWLVGKFYEKSKSEKVVIILLAFGGGVLRAILETILVTAPLLVIFDSVSLPMWTTLIILSIMFYLWLGKWAEKRGGKRNLLGYFLEISSSLVSGYFAVIYQSLWVGLVVQFFSTPTMAVLGFLVALITKKIYQEKYKYNLSRNR